MNNPFEEYGAKSKSIQELIDQFALDLMTYHFIPLKGIEFNEQSMDKFRYELSKSTRFMKDKTVLGDEIKLATPVGYVFVKGVK